MFQISTDHSPPKKRHCALVSGRATRLHVGLPNLGNTCFIAATLQLLKSSSAVRELAARHRLGHHDEGILHGLLMQTPYHVNTFIRKRQTSHHKQKNGDNNNSNNNKVN